MVQGQYQIEIRRTLYEQDARWKQKLVLRAISMFFSLLGVIIFGIVLFKTLALTTTSAGGQNPDIVLEGPHVQDGLPLAPLGIGTLANPFILMVVLYVRRGIRLHPILPILLDVTMVGLCIPCLILLGDYGLFLLWAPYGKIDAVVAGCYNLNLFAEPCFPMIYHMGRLEITGMVILSIVLLIHSTLVVMSCLEWWKIRAQRRTAEQVRRSLQLQYNRNPEEFDRAQHRLQKPPTYVSTRDVTHDKDADGKEDCNMAGLGCYTH